MDLIVASSFIDFQTSKIVSGHEQSQENIFKHPTHPSHSISFQDTVPDFLHQHRASQLKNFLYKMFPIWHWESRTGFRKPNVLAAKHLYKQGYLTCYTNFEPPNQKNFFHKKFSHLVWGVQNQFQNPKISYKQGYCTFYCHTRPNLKFQLS